MDELTPFEREAIRLALVKMFRPEGFFDVYTLDKCCKIAGVTPDTRLRDTLHALHCIAWSDMSPTMRQAVADQVIHLLAVPRLDLSALEPIPEPVSVSTPRSLFRKLRA